MVIATMVVVSRARTTISSASRRRRKRPPSPPVAEGAPLVGVVPAILCTKGLPGVIREQHSKLGSVFTLSALGIKVTFLVGPKACAHFFHATESEISIGDVYKMTVPIFGKGVGYDVDNDTRNEQHRFFADALRPAKLRSYVAPMLREVEEYFAKWGQCGTVDLKQEMDTVLMLMASRCLLGEEVRDHMHGEVSSLLHDLTGGLHLASMFFPYLPTPAHRRRDKARARLEEIFSGIVRSRRSSGRAGDDLLQVLIDSRYKKDGRATTEAEITGLLVALLFAGHHTSSTAAAWTVARLLRHGEWLRAATEEQRRLRLRPPPQGQGDYDGVLRMDVLHAA
nr:unnamed protein product [Digitaria exilis]